MAIKTYLSSNEIKRMIDSANNLRDKVILSFLGDCGCRVSEMLAITVRDLDLDRLEVVIPHLKRGIKKHCPKCNNTAGKSTRYCAKCGSDLTNVMATGIEERTRLVTIGEDTGKLIAEYLQSRGQMSSEDKLIDITRQMVYLVVRDAAKAIGITGKAILNPETGKYHYVHPHDFRSSLAVAWLEYAGGDANKQKALQTALGHKSFETTIRYNKITPSTVRGVGDEVRARRFGAEVK